MAGLNFRSGTRGLLLAASMLSGAAFAEQAPDATTSQSKTAAASPASGLEDIVVTAQRRKESVQTVPIAVTAFSSASLEAKNVQSTLQLVQYVPNLFGSNNTGLGSANVYYIRGLGNTESIATFDPPVGTYIDDIYLARQNANNFSFFDVERVEVLRGPQGTLYGRNTTGGAVNVILKQPGSEVGGYAEVAYGAYQKKLVRASLDIPLNPSFQLKLSGYFQESKGYVHNTTTGETLNDDDGSGIRLAAKISMSDQLTWNLAAAYTQSKGDNLLNFPCDPNNPTNCSGRFVSTGLRTTTNSYLPLVIAGRKSQFGLGNDAQNQLYSSNIQYAGDDFTFNFITGYVNLTQKFALDFADGRGLPSLTSPTPAVKGYSLGGFSILNDGSAREFTQEIKINGKLFGGFLDYVAGFYYFNEKDRTDLADVFTIATLPFPPFTVQPLPLGFPLLLGDRVVNNKTEAYAGYFQGDLNFTDKLKFTAGVRYTDEKKSFIISDNRGTCAAGQAAATTSSCLNQGNLIASNGTPIPTSQTKRLWTPRFVLNYQASHDLLVYASATKGFKSGGWNARGYTANVLLPFGSEEAWSYEAGIKSEFFDRRLRVNANVFFEDVKGLQTPSAFVAPNGTVSFITQNFADYRNRGVELEVTALPVDNLSVYFNMGYQKDNYRVSHNVPDFNQFNVKSVSRQQIDCLAELAAGKVAGTAAATNAADCAAGIVTANGSIARPVRTPRVSIAGGGSYDFKLPSAGIILTPSVNVIYRSNFETGTANFAIYSGPITVGGVTYPANPYSGTPIDGSKNTGYVLVNASVALRTDDKNWTLALECSNCFDKNYIESSLANTTYINPPRTWQVRLKRDF